jgi:hypothetical protein
VKPTPTAEPIVSLHFTTLLFLRRKKSPLFSVWRRLTLTAMKTQKLSIRAPRELVEAIDQVVQAHNQAHGTSIDRSDIVRRALFREIAGMPSPDVPPTLALAKFPNPH